MVTSLRQRDRLGQRSCLPLDAADACPEATQRGANRETDLSPVIVG
jgi:hypothetical protein